MDYLLTKADMDLYYDMVRYGLLAVSFKNDHFRRILLKKKRETMPDIRIWLNYGLQKQQYTPRKFPPNSYFSTEKTAV